MKNKIKKASKLRQLDVAMDECTCYQCGAGTVETYEIEGTYRDAKTLKPFNQYQRVTWQSLGDDEYDFYHKSSIHYDDYAETTDGMVVIRRDDLVEEITREEYCQNIKCNGCAEFGGMDCTCKRNLTDALPLAEYKGSKS